MSMEINGNLIAHVVNKQNYNNYTTGYANTAKKTAVPRARTKKKKE